jgi:signal transduction histidine kinase
MMRKIVLILTITGIAFLHYFSPIHYHNLHAIYQRLYYVPLILGAYWFGLRQGMIFAFIAAISYIPHIYFQWSHDPMQSFTQYVEIVMFFGIASLVGVLSDIQKKHQLQIEEANKNMRIMERLSLLGQLAAGLAHEIRNPLSSIIGSVEILKDKFKNDKEGAEFAEIMKKELKKMNDKLNEFLRFAKPTPVQSVPNNLNDVVKATVNFVQNQALKAGVAIRIELDDSLPIIPMDAEQLKQALLNLILNAMQAMPKGGNITTGTWKSEKIIGFFVEDDGPGIPENLREKVFEPFYTTKADGTGLGLSIVKQLVEAMHGNVTARQGKTGARFEVEIPNGQ